MIDSPLERARTALRRAVDDLLAVMRRPVPEYDVKFGASLLLHNRAFVQLVHGNDQLKRAARETIDAYEREAGIVQARFRRLLRILGRLRDRIVTRFPEAAAMTRNPADGEEFFYSIPEFTAHLNGALAGNPWSEIVEPHHEGFSRELQWACHLLTQVPGGPSKSDIAPFIERTGKLIRIERHTLRDLIVLFRNHPGARWNWLVRLSNAINASQGSWAAFEEVAVRFGDGVPPNAFIFETDQVEQKHIEALRHLVVSMEEHVRAAASAFELRLGLRASVVGVLARYATRTRRLRLRELRALLESEYRKTNERETMLTRDAALFLFDQGFEAVTAEQPAGQHRYDVLAGARGPDDLVLVEGKICDASKNAIKALVEGLRQIHGYVAALGSELPVPPEPVLLLYRLGGPTITLPEEYDVQGVNVRLVLVDLGSSADSGSKTKASKGITTAEIHAALSAPTQRQRAGRPTRKAPRPRR
jgi:hypothetical protein